MSKNMRREIEQEVMKFIMDGRMKGISGEQIKEIIDTALEFRLNYQFNDKHLKGKYGSRKRDLVERTR